MKARRIGERKGHAARATARRAARRARLEAERLERVKLEKAWVEERFKREPPSEEPVWYVKKPETLGLVGDPPALPHGCLRLANGAVVTLEVAAMMEEQRQSEWRTTMGDESWAGMCEHMRALWLQIEASPITFSGGEGVDADCSACGRGAIDVELARGRTK